MDSQGVTQEQKALFLPLFKQRMEQWMKLSEDVQKKGQDFETEVQNDSALQDQIKAETEATFKAADTDGNGILNKATFSDFGWKDYHNQKARFGDSIKPNEQTQAKWWDAMQTLSPDVDGISLDDIFLTWKIGIALTPQLM